MTNKISNIYCYVKGKTFQGSIDRNILSGTYNNKNKMTKFESIYEAFNFVLDNCDTSRKYDDMPIMTLYMMAPGWVSQSDKPKKVKLGIYFTNKSHNFTIKFYYSPKSRLTSDRWIIVKEKIKSFEDVKKIMQDIIQGKNINSAKNDSNFVVKKEDYFK